MQLLWLIILDALSNLSLNCLWVPPNPLLYSARLGWDGCFDVLSVPYLGRKDTFSYAPRRGEKTAQDLLWNDSMEGGGDSGKKALLKNKIAGWNDGSAIKPLHRSQYQLPVSPALGDRVTSSDLCGHLHTCSIHTDTQTKVNLETNKNRKLLLYLFSEKVQNCFGL